MPTPPCHQLTAMSQEGLGLNLRAGQRHEQTSTYTANTAVSVVGPKPDATRGDGRVHMSRSIDICIDIALSHPPAVTRSGQSRRQQCRPRLRRSCRPAETGLLQRVSRADGGYDHDHQGGDGRRPRHRRGLPASVMAKALAPASSAGPHGWKDRRIRQSANRARSACHSQAISAPGEVEPGPSLTPDPCSSAGPSRSARQIERAGVRECQFRRRPARPRSASCVTLAAKAFRAACSNARRVIMWPGGLPRGYACLRAVRERPAGRAGQGR
jgi:hypothetical protein